LNLIIWKNEFYRKIRLVNDKWLIICFYFLNHGAILLLYESLYWDDWTLWRQDSDIIKKVFDQAASPFAGYIYIFFNSFEYSTLIYRLVIFFSYLVAASSFYGILRAFSLISQQQRLLLVFVFIAFPVNSARISLNTASYSICYALFYFGFWILVTYKTLNNKSHLLRIIVLIFFFFLSIQTQS
jgi:hypothetical protein